MEPCIIYVRTPEESERVQKVLLAAGAIRRFGPADPKDVAFTSRPFIVLRNGKFETLGFFKSLEDHSDIAKHVDENYVTDVTFPPLQPEVMITVKGKEYSENTLDLMIRQYVEKET